MATQRSIVVTMRSRQTPRGSARRGVALLVVISAITVLAAVAVEFAYNTRINLHLAANARDELRALYLARSATELAKLVLFFQRNVDGQMRQINQAIQQGIKESGMANQMAVPNINIQLWKLIPIDSAFLTEVAMAGFSDGELEQMDTGDSSAEAESVRGFGDFQGEFEAEIEDESGKICLQDLRFKGLRRNVVIQQIVNLIAPRKYDFLFENKDADGQYTTREEFVAALVDFADDYAADSGRAFDLNVMDNIGGSEDMYYQNLKVPYRAKNASLDTNEEMHFIRGIGDDFMRVFGDKFTVYPGDPNQLINWCSADWQMKFATLCAAIGETRRDMALAFGCGTGNEEIQKRVLELFEEWQQAREQTDFLAALGGCDVTPQDFQAFVSEVIRQPLPPPPSGYNYFGMRSTSFTIRATGRVGTTRRTITTVVSNAKPGLETWYYHED